MLWFLLITCGQWVLPGPATNPEPRDEIPYRLDILKPGEHLGVAVLRPKNRGFLNQPDWAKHPKRHLGWLMSVRLPVFDKPERHPAGWLTDGWLVPETGKPIPLDSMLHRVVSLGQGLEGLPVWEVRGDGWLRFGQMDGTRYWTHERFLASRPEPLERVRWGALLMEHNGALFPIEQDQRLYGSPEPDAAFQVIEKTTRIEILEQKDHWAKVRLNHTGSQDRQGWLRWFDPKRGPLLFFAPKGM